MDTQQNFQIQILKIGPVPHIANYLGLLEVFHSICRSVFNKCHNTEQSEYQFFIPTKKNLSW